MIKTWRLFFIIALCLAGTAVSMHLTNIHINHIKTGIPSSCSFNESFDCDAVNTSRWSELGGIPIAHLGMLTYLLTLWITLTATFNEKTRERAHAFLFLLSSWCVVFSIYMAYIALVIIKSVCVWCLSLYVINILMLAASWRGGLKSILVFKNHFSEELASLKKPAFLITICIMIFLAAGSCLYLRSDLKNARTMANIRIPRISVNTFGAPSKGPTDARIVIIEISDFECPFCRKANEAITEAIKDYPKDVRLIFKHFPLDNKCNPVVPRPFHQSACDAAKAAVCAGKKGFFWEYSDRLMRGSIEKTALFGYARSLGIPEQDFGSCLSLKETEDIISKDIKDCASLGIDGVPVFLINGRKMVGAQSVEKFKQIIDEELAVSR